MVTHPVTMIPYITMVTLVTSLHVSPYPPNQHGSVRSVREVRQCHSVQGRAEIFELYNKTDNNEENGDNLEVKYFIDDIPNSFPHRFAYGHVAVVRKPVETLSFLEPDHTGSCTETKTQQRNVTYTANQHDCMYAVNGGYFNVSNGNCLGNMYSDGRLVINSRGLMNPNFGVLSNGSLVVGYLAEEHVLSLNFTNLVQGIIWLVRDKQNYVSESQTMECTESQTTGSMEYFVRTNSARSAIGHDKDGNVLLVHVEGKTGTNRGINLHEFADLLVEHGLVNAINLDGGGSTHAAYNGTLISYPSNHCETEDGMYRCELEISSVICVHRVARDVARACVHGVSRPDNTCVCEAGYTGQSCDIPVTCPGHCANQGACIRGVCECYQGYSGINCNVTCCNATFPGSPANLTVKELGILGITIGLVAVCIISITFNVFYYLKYDKKSKPRDRSGRVSSNRPSLAPVPISVSEHQKRQIPIYTEISRDKSRKQMLGREYELQNKSKLDKSKDLLDRIDREMVDESESDDDTSRLLKR